ncbi:coiled-coil domain-containing protein 60-like isoform X2 [Dreissena polymorpha]|uniref:coiled-coil domain-containing protein 60-like isoform X2 n=1 Tax=Dreissena polymorpha TaxID=45954 RepID=UPI002264059E|nr:coiled-coil domain-containing protein 60-like isoform X2 [Dreissena polymorpha]
MSSKVSANKMPASQDPRSYVKPVPLPIPACKGLRLLARDTIHFNPEFPTREDVRKSNYKRRQFQMACTGFKAANHKPYIGIGDPFYLDQKKMILHALGQWSEDQASSSSSSEESDTEDHASDDVPKPAFTAAKFVLRRSRKDLNTLNKAVVHGRNMIRNVSLGHGLFDLIHKEKESKKLEKEEALRLQQEALRNEFQPPKAASDDETDEDLETDVDLTSYMVAVAPPAFLTQQQVDTDKELGIVNDNASDSDQSPEREPAFQTFTGMVLQAEEEEYQRARSAVVASQMTSMYSRPVSQRRKKQETPRPYTPQHTNISVNMSARTDLMSAENEHEFDITKDALFRQLCVLHWILEAMSTDPPSAMTPIMSCWSLTSEIGGSRAQQRKLLKDKAVESSWEKFSKETTKIKPNIFNIAMVGKRLSAARGTRGAHGRRQLHVPGRGSAQSSANASQLGSSQGLNSGGGQVASLAVRNHGDEGLSTTVEQEEDPATNQSIFKFLDEYYESLKKEEEKEKQAGARSPASTPSSSPTPASKQQTEEKKKKKRKKSKTREESAFDKRSDSRGTGDGDRRTSRAVRATPHIIRGKSSPALLEFQMTKPSNKKGLLTADLHNQFAECREERALTLHDILDHKESQRLAVCKSKFISLQGMRHGSSFHRAVQDMRTESWQRLRKPIEDRKKSSAKGNWYTDLLDKIPEELKKEWYYGKILQKLANFGLVEGSGKQSIYKFIKVLEGLREWEICSPDITAAIEFCREHIVEMTVEEYESWFSQRFPRITRPQTAPPATAAKPDRDVRLETADKLRPNAPKRPTQSAFVRRATQK